MDDKKQTWEDSAPRWSRQADQSQDKYTLLISAVCELIEQRIPPGKALDIGCGPGLLCERLHNQGFGVHGTDIAEAMIAAARQRMGALGDDVHDRFRQCPDGDIPFDECDFDLVTATQLFPYIEQYTPYIRKIRRLLKPGGFLIASNTNRFSLFVFLQICNRLFRIPPHISTLRNLIRTGYHSGGHVNYHRAQQAYSAGAFDKFVTAEGFDIVGELNWYHIRRLDRKALERTGLAALLARRLGWQHLGVYRKRAGEES